MQCGIGRTGNFFAFENSKVKPDIVPIAKGIGGGFPIGAVLMTKKVASSMTKKDQQKLIDKFIKDMG